MSTASRILAVADSDSYVKWAAFLLDRMPEGWDRELAVVTTPWQPSRDQLTAAVAGTRWQDAPPSSIDLDRIGEVVAERRPDVVLIAARGPSVKVIHRAVVSSGLRPVIASGLPGISYPATRKAIAYRAQADVMVVHSRREVDAFTRLAERMGVAQSFALASLPFVERGEAPGPREGGAIVFAPQAKFPIEREQRLALLEALAETARRHPDRRVVVKVRTSTGELQTHAERHDYRDLIRLVDAPPNLVVEGGAMAAHLAAASALVTLSSTALLEAIGMGVPVLALEDFGIRRRYVNTGFLDSGFLGTLDDLVAGRFRHPDPAWLDENWFHPSSADDWVERLDRLIALREAGALPERVQLTGTTGGRLRLAWDRKHMLGPLDRSLSGRLALIVGTPALRVLLLARRIRRRLRALGLGHAPLAATEEIPDEELEPTPGPAAGPLPAA